MNKISLSSSLHTCLLSLRSTARLQKVTGERIASGLKVNSAIDNPTSFYTAKSLSHRADDLNKLLDSMNQGVQTLKAASLTLETASETLAQAMSIATQSLQENPIPPPEWFTEKLGEYGAVVTTETELREALDANKETIVVYGTIQTQNPVVLKPNQNLVGVGYFTGQEFNPSEKVFSCLEINLPPDSNTALVANSSVVSDLRITASFSQDAGMLVSSRNSTLHNLDLRQHEEPWADIRGIYRLESNTISGRINIETSGYSSFNDSNAVTTTIKSNTRLTANNVIYNLHGTTMVIEDNVSLKAKAIVNHQGPEGYIWGGNSTLIGRNVKLSLSYLSNLLSTNNNSLTGKEENFLSIGKGTTIYFHNSRETYLCETDFEHHSNPEQGKRFDTFNDIAGFRKISDMTEEIIKDKKVIPDESSGTYNLTLSQYNQLISDSSYNGVNLLEAQSVLIKFNENGSSLIELNGVDASSAAIGLNLADWKTQGDIAQSLAELSSALTAVRTFSEHFGNYYSIVTNREQFTEKMINILTEGAEKLTLADMNQESAAMLALQTRQQLAVNSLSLAGQASRSILKLF